MPLEFSIPLEQVFISRNSEYFRMQFMFINTSLDETSIVFQVNNGFECFFFVNLEYFPLAGQVKSFGLHVQ